MSSLSISLGPPSRAPSPVAVPSGTGTTSASTNASAQSWKSSADTQTFDPSALGQPNIVVPFTTSTTAMTPTTSDQPDLERRKGGGGGLVLIDSAHRSAEAACSKATADASRVAGKDKVATYTDYLGAVQETQCSGSSGSSNTRNPVTKVIDGVRHIRDGAQWVAQNVAERWN